MWCRKNDSFIFIICYVVVKKHYMETCGFCTEEKYANMVMCLGCYIKICYDCHVIGIKLNTCSYKNISTFYCSSKCFYEGIRKYSREYIDAYYTLIFNNDKNYIYTQLIRREQLEYLEGINIPKINIIVQTCIEVKELCNIVCEYVNCDQEK